MICGFLDLNGQYYPCSRWEHTSKASQLVAERNADLVMKDPYEMAEDVLLHNGWICIRGSDVYKGIYSYDGEVLFISDAQQQFFADHKEELNEVQISHIERMLRDFGKLYEWHKGDPGYE